jgi:hypothetical protein
MRSIRSLWCLAALSLSACSLITDFDPEGQPCDSQGRCLEGYVCRNKICVESPGSVTDGGTRSGNLCETPHGCLEPPSEAASEPVPEGASEVR